jgi:hemerythrin-like domain-containing protein
MKTFDDTRRRALAGGLALAGAAALLPSAAMAENKGKRAGEEKEVGAVEDLMREHGVLRRALLVYRETAPKIRSGGAGIDPALLNRTAKLFRSFGEDYHEKKLEEAFIFPVVRKAPGPAASYPDVLTAQHDRGREVTDYIIAVTGKGQIGTGQAEPLARVMESFVLMYENHAAREDTIVFPAWKTAISEKELDELGDKFEEIEKQQFGKDGFEDAVAQIGEIERALGVADISRFTPSPPPKG